MKRLKINHNKKGIRIFIAAMLFLFALEIYLRAYWGFCDNVLMMASDKYEYIFQPNQQRFRFRNHIYVNKYSMRSPEVDSTAYTILGFGDSIINGGVAVDQDSLTTTLLSKELSAEQHKKIQVLNIAAGSWGPDNCYAYLQEKGDFNARIVFLTVSSHDAHDNMDFKPVIDQVIRYESKQYKIAVWELIQKYALPKMKDKLGMGSYEKEIAKNGPVFNTGFKNLYEYCLAKEIPFFIYLHPDKTELESKAYNAQGQEIIAFCKEKRIPCIQSLQSLEPGDYRGIIHMNSRGQQHMKADLKPYLSALIQNNKQ